MAEKKTKFVCVYKEHEGYRSEIHQQQYGNRNYVVVVVPPAFAPLGVMQYRAPVREYRRTSIVYTVYTKADWCERGEYAEEIDIEVGSRTSRAEVKRIATAVLAAEYEPGLRPAKVVERFGMFI